MTPIDKTLIQIAYVSSTRGLLTAAAIADLLVSSRQRNHARGITGVLLYKDGNVLQVIEGEEARVVALFASILKDRRHSGVIKMYQKPIAARDFPDWTMGFRDLKAEPARQLVGFSEILEPSFDLSTLTPSSATKLLISFKASLR